MNAVSSFVYLLTGDAGVQFTNPMIFFLLPAPLLVLLLPPIKSNMDTALKIPTYELLKSIPVATEKHSSALKLFLLSLIWILVVLAASRPQWIGEPVQMPATGRDLLLAVDISQSMEIEDMVYRNQQIPRINVVKAIVNDFVSKRNGDRLGLVVFGTQAHLHVPLTFDRNVVQQQLEEAQLGFAGGSTAIGDAIAISVKKLRELPAIDQTNNNSGRVMILLTDGANTAGEIEPREAAGLAETAKVKIYTIGLGADSMVERSFFFNRQVNPSRDLDEESLQYIADLTGGQYFRARNPEQLQQIYQTINELEPLPQEAETFRPIKSLYYFPLGAAITISLLWGIFIILSRIAQQRQTRTDEAFTGELRHG